MDWLLTLSIIFGAFVVLLVLGVPVAFAFTFINLVGAIVFWGGDIGQLVLSIFKSVTNFALLPVPLFILMGEIMFQSGVASRTMEALDKWLGRLPGRLSILSVGAGVIFATMTGSSAAGVAMLGSLLVPEMEKHGYKKPMSLGPIMGSGGLAMMIPPSALGVLLASLGYISVGSFLIAIILPGLVMALLYALYIVIRCTVQPELAPPYEVQPIRFLARVWMSFCYILPLGFIVFLVIGLMLLGVATPTEAAALGTLGCTILAFAYGGMNWETIRKSLTGTLHVTVMIFMILTGSTAFAELLAYTGATRGLVELIRGLSLPPLMIVVAMQMVLLLLGCFMEPLSIMMLTIPIFMPIVDVLGLNKLWFAALVLINMETAVITPPFGTSLFVMKGVAPRGTSIGDVYKASLPFVALNCVAMALLMVFPGIPLWLPGLMKN